MIFNFILVGLGGAIGSMLRHGAGMIALRFGLVNFPWATFTVNIVGSLLIGLISGLLAFKTDWPQDVRLFAVVGVLGGFTTFSAFSLDTILLFERGQILSAVLYVAGSVALSLCATFLGLFLVRIFA